MRSANGISRAEYESLVCRGMSEAALQAHIQRTTDALRLLSYHVNVSGGPCPKCGHRRKPDRRGFPDFWLPAPPTLHVWELKAAKGKATPEQEHWLAALSACERIDARLIRPADWPEARQSLLRDLGITE